MVALAGNGWRLAPCLVALFDEADRLYPKRSHASDGSLGDQAHRARASDHNPDATGDVLAGDLTDDKDAGCDADAFAEHLRTVRDHRVKYVICNGRVFRSYGDRAWEWTPYNGINGHFAHTHVSVLDTLEAKNDRSPWFPLPTPTEPEEPVSFYLEDTLATANHPTQPARVDECIVGTDGAVWHRKGTATSPGEFDESLGGNDGGPVRSVACAWTSDGMQFVVNIHGFDNKPYRRVYTEGAEGWGEWFLTHGALTAGRL